MQRSVLRMLHCGDSCKFPCKSIFIASGRLGERQTPRKATLFEVDWTGQDRRSRQRDENCVACFCAFNRV